MLKLSKKQASLLTGVKSVRQPIYRFGKTILKEVDAQDLDIQAWPNGGHTALVDAYGETKSATVKGDPEATRFRLDLEIATMDDPEGRFLEGNERLALIAL